ncbi:hypothetical protein BCR34DRAFT_554934 [Clohesyomyces aquaticus]|uniref:Uncharacterized protein n=1 Tax=Clohesyomyces aquaticus TaxID=1231657 RepID=A0A1Y2A5M8_9PLEO|nr:hypothetical protein BCR34DRAFT_554934 [Clohesyomyces aquaticus]
MDRYGDLLDGLEAVLRPSHGITESDKREMLRVLKTFRVEIPSYPPPAPFKSFNPRTHSGYGPPVALDRGFYFPHSHPDYNKFYGGTTSRANASTSPPSSPLSDENRKIYRSSAPSPPPPAPRRNALPKISPTPREIQYTDVYGRPISPDVVAKFHNEAPKPKTVNSETDEGGTARTKPWSPSPKSFVHPNDGPGGIKTAEEKYGKTDAPNGEDTEQKVAVKDAKRDNKEKKEVKRNDRGKNVTMKDTPDSPNEGKDNSKTTQESATSQDSHAVTQNSRTQDSQTQGFPKAAANIKQKRAALPTTPTLTATAQAQPITAPWLSASSTTLDPDMIWQRRTEDEATINKGLQSGSPFASASTGASFCHPFGQDDVDEDTDEDTEGEEEEDCTLRTIQSTQPAQESPPTGSLLRKRGRNFGEDEDEDEDDDEADAGDAETTKEACRSTSHGEDRKQNKRFKRE